MSDDQLLKTEEMLKPKKQDNRLVTPPGSLVDWATALALVDIAKSLRKLSGRE